MKRALFHPGLPSGDIKGPETWKAWWKWHWTQPGLKWWQKINLLLAMPHVELDGDKNQWVVVTYKIYRDAIYVMDVRRRTIKENEVV